MTKKLHATVEVEWTSEPPADVSVPEDLYTEAEMEDRIRQELNLTRPDIQDATVSASWEVVADD